MKIEKIDIIELIPEDEYRISIPSDPGLHEIFLKYFPGIPPIVTDPKKVIISGYDSYDFMIRNRIGQSEVVVTDIGKKETLFLACNSRAVIKPLSLYEKLNFLKNIIKHSDISEIYRRTQLGIRIDENLFSILPDLTGGFFRELLSGNRISLKAAIRMCSFTEEDRETLAGLFSTVSFSSSNELNVLDMTAEICFRDKTNAESVLKLIKADSLYLEKDPSSAILSELSRLRYPSYSDHEKEWKDEVAKIKIPLRHSIHHSPFFEKKGIELRLFLDSIEKIKEISEKIGD